VLNSISEWGGFGLSASKSHRLTHPSRPTPSYIPNSTRSSQPNSALSQAQDSTSFWYVPRDQQDSAEQNTASKCCRFPTVYGLSALII